MRKGMLTPSLFTSIVYASSDFSAIFSVFRLGAQALKRTSRDGSIHASMNACVRVERIEIVRTHSYSGMPVCAFTLWQTHIYSLAHARQHTPHNSVGESEIGQLQRVAP